MLTATNEKYVFVYNHLFAMYSKIAMETFEYLTNELVAVISQSTYAEIIQMAQLGVLDEFYTRLKEGRIW